MSGDILSKNDIEASTAAWNANDGVISQNYQTREPFDFKNFIEINHISSDPKTRVLTSKLSPITASSPINLSSPPPLVQLT